MITLSVFYKSFICSARIEVSSSNLTNCKMEVNYARYLFENLTYLRQSFEEDGAQPEKQICTLKLHS